MDEMENSGILFICAAGNNGLWGNSQFYPACFDIPNIISVAAIDNTGKRTYFSNYGTDIDVAAPGMDIYSTLPGNTYGYESGTSMAAPFVTGIVALLKSLELEITNKEIKSRIVSSVMVSDYLEEDVVNSSGIVDAYTTLLPPSSLHISGISYENSIFLSWNSTINATGYEVLNNDQVIDNGISTTYIKNDLTPETPYIFSVREKFGTERGYWSNRIMKATLTTGDGTGIRGEYFSGTDLKNIMFVRTDETVDFEEPSDMNTHEEGASIRWSGRIQSAYTEDYSFYVSIKGGVRLWVGENLIIDHWDNQTQNEFTGSIKLDSRWKYFIRMEYKTDSGDVCAKLYWLSESQPKEIVPKSRLISTPYIGENSGTWSFDGMMPTSRFSLGVAELNNKIYTIGGFDGIQGPDDHWSSLISNVEEYDIKTQKWTQKARVPLDSVEFSTSVAKGKIYTFGGWQSDGEFYSNRVYAFDPIFNKWSTKASMPTGRSQLSAVNVNDKIYAIGGLKENEDGSTSVTDVVEEYDPILNLWSQKTSMIHARRDMAAAEVDGKIYTFGGIGSDYHSTDIVEMYDPELNEWFSRANMPEAKSYAAAAVLDDKIYVIGGYIEGLGIENIKYDVQEYDPLLDKWTRVENIPTPRAEFGAVSVDGRIYTIGGRIYNGTNKNDYALNYLESFDSNRQKLINEFAIEGQVDTSIIDKSNYSIEFTMPYGTDVTSLSPVISVSSCASISPQSGEPVDFSKPSKYIVTGGDGSTREWVVKCSVQEPEIIIASLLSDKSSPQPANTPITWTCNATGSTSLQYAFHVYTESKGWEMVRGYSSDNQYTWIPEAGRDYIICVWVKDAASQNVFDTNISAYYTVNDYGQ